MPESPSWSSPVLASVLPVIAVSRHVTTDTDAIERAAEWLAAEELGWPTASMPLDTPGDPDLLTDFLMFTNAINFAFTDFATRDRFEADRGGRRWSDSEGMTACVLNALDAGVPVLDGAWMAEATIDDIDRLFTGSIQMPMLPERTAIINDVGRVLADRYRGRWRHWAADCAPAMYAGGDGLLERLVTEFPRYRDVSDYDGFEVRLYKLAQLGLWTLH
ncbi:MAG: queuosine salvage family protein, partial [Chloroflexota bacterium]